MNRITISTTKTLHPPIEVEIDGQVYAVRLNRGTFERIEELAVELRKIRPDTTDNYRAIFILYEQIEMMTGAPREVVEKIDYNDLKSIIDFIFEKYYGKAPAPATPPVAVPETSPEAGAEKIGESAKNG